MCGGFLEAKWHNMYDILSVFYCINESKITRTVIVHSHWHNHCVHERVPIQTEFVQNENPNEPDIHRMIDDGIVLYEIFLEFKSDDEKAIINQCLRGFKSTPQCANSVPKKRKIQDLLTNIEPKSSLKRIKLT